MKIKLSPLQIIYNNLSIALDTYDKNLIAICETIKDRIFDIIGNIDNYDRNDSNNFKSKQVLKAVKSLIYVYHPESKHNIHMAKHFDNVIRFLFLDHKISNENIKENITLKRASSIQDKPFKYLKYESKIELNVLLTMWVDHLELSLNDSLDVCVEIDSLLPRRRGIEFYNKKGISKKDWLKVAA